jgi:fumarate hydratase class I
MRTLVYPYRQDDIRSLKAGDTVSLNGVVWTGRDRFHKYFVDGGKLPVDFRDGALYHCGPVVVFRDGKWHAVACGPTTSVRENPYEPEFIASSGVRVIIGKGGMDENTLEACRKYGAVYLQAVGGAAAITASCVKSIQNVYFLEEFGAAEACWEFEMKDFKCVVAMDSHGVSLFEKIRLESKKKYSKLIGKD